MSSHHAHVEEWETTESVRLIRIKDRAASNVTVRSQCRVPKFYEITVTRRGSGNGNLPYSLVNLGIQTLHTPVRLVGLSRDVVLSKSKSSETVSLSPGSIPKGGFPLEKVKGSSSADPVWLLNFDDKECTLYVTTLPPDAVLETMEGHDVAPPPPDPAGEN